MGLAHWDDVEWHRRAKGEMDAEWQFLGGASQGSSVYYADPARADPAPAP